MISRALTQRHPQHNSDGSFDAKNRSGSSGERRADIPSDGHLPAPKINPFELLSFPANSRSSCTALPGTVMMMVVVERPRAQLHVIELDIMNVLE